MPAARRRTTRLKASASETVYSEVADIEDAVASTSHSSSESKSRVRGRKDIAPATKVSKKFKAPLSTPLEPPPMWEEQYNRIRDMRKDILAPVDTMGCAHLGKPEKDPRNFRFATLVSLILSPQTKDESLYEAIKNLRQVLGGAISIDAVLATDPKTMKDAIRSIGMQEKKVGFLKKAAEILKNEFDSDVPKTIEDITRIPGVGPKVGFLCLQIAWDETLASGIGVDSHLFKITKRLKWHSSEKEEDARVQIESWLPRDHWREINTVMVGFGQVVCLTGRNQVPRCDRCTLTKELCSFRKNVQTKETAKIRSGTLPDLGFLCGVNMAY